MSNATTINNQSPEGFSMNTRPLTPTYQISKCGNYRLDHTNYNLNHLEVKQGGQWGVIWYTPATKVQDATYEYTDYLLAEEEGF